MLNICIQLLTYLVTVLDTTTILVTILLVCLRSRRNKGRFGALFALRPLGGGSPGPYFDQVSASGFMHDVLACV